MEGMASSAKVKLLAPKPKPGPTSSPPSKYDDVSGAPAPVVAPADPLSAVVLGLLGRRTGDAGGGGGGSRAPALTLANDNTQREKERERERERESQRHRNIDRNAHTEPSQNVKRSYI
jgi:hypothetical protein